MRCIYDYICSFTDKLCVALFFLPTNFMMNSCEEYKNDPSIGEEMVELVNKDDINEQKLYGFELV